MEPQRISSHDELEAALAATGERPLVLLKHSTRCPVSAHAHDEVLRFAADLEPRAASVAIVYVVEDRPLSNAIAERLGIRHESPQAFVISGGDVLWHESHSGIQQAALSRALEAAATSSAPVSPG